MKTREITWKTWLYGLFFAIYVLLVLMQFLRLGFLGYWEQFSRWCYIFYGLYFMAITLAAWVPLMRNLAFDFLFMSVGLAFLWTFLTTMLVVFGVETVVTNADTNIQDMGWQLVGLGFVHYAPIVIVVIYLLDQRSPAAKYWGKVTRYMALHATWVAPVLYYAFWIWTPLLLALIYRLIFDPFAAYDLDPVPYQYLWIELVAVLLVPVIGFALLAFLYTDEKYRKSIKT